MRKKDYILIFVAFLVAFIAPIFLMSFVYSIGQLFLPEGNIVLTPALRITCSWCVVIMDYALAYVFIWFTSKRKKVLFNAVFFVLTAFWNIFLALLWYLSL